MPPAMPQTPMDIIDQLNAPVLGLYGGADQGIPLDLVERMRGGREVQRNLRGADGLLLLLLERVSRGLDALVGQRLHDHAGGKRQHLPGFAAELARRRLASLSYGQVRRVRMVGMPQLVEQRVTSLRGYIHDITATYTVQQALRQSEERLRLTVSAVRDGPQHADTVAFKRTAADLVWAASAKPNRSDRAQVIQNLPALLQRLRTSNTSLVGMLSTLMDLARLDSGSFDAMQASVRLDGVLDETRLQFELAAERLADTADSGNKSRLFHGY